MPLCKYSTRGLWSVYTCTICTDQMETSSIFWDLLQWGVCQYLDRFSASLRKWGGRTNPWKRSNWTSQPLFAENSHWGHHVGHIFGLCYTYTDIFWWPRDFLSITQRAIIAKVQLSKSSRSKNGGAYFSAVCGSNLVPVSATEAHWHRVCDRLLGFFSRAHFFCFPEVCRAQSWTACRPTLWKYGWKDDKYLWAPKSQTAAATAANVWSGCKTFKGPQRARGLTAAVSLFGAHKYFSSFQPYFQRVSRQAVQLWARQTSGKQKKWALEKKTKQPTADCFCSTNRN